MKIRLIFVFLYFLPFCAIGAQYRVRDINPGAGHSSPSGFAVLGETVLFRANDGANGTELWKSDGTSAGTMLVRDINPGSASSNPGLLTVMDGVLYFTANDGVNGIELWKSDGTAAGTVPVKDINPGSAHSSPTNLVVLGNTLFFRASDGANGIELWRSDGTSSGTVMVADLNPGSGSSSPSNLVLHGSTLYFTATNGTDGVELWRSLPPWNAASTSLVADINSGAGGSFPANLTPAGPLLYFSADDGKSGRELWVSDGTAASTRLVADIAPGSPSSSPSFLVFTGPFLLFTADDGAIGRELWKSDGTAAGTTLIADLRPGPTSSNVSSLVAFGLRVFFTADNGTNGLELWQSLPPYVAATTAMPRDMNPGAGHGIPSGASEVAVIPIYPSAHNVRMLYAGTDGVNGGELWVSDGTAAGTYMVADINPGAGSSAPANFMRAGDRVFFSATDGTSGLELWAVRLGRFGGALAEPFGAGCSGTGRWTPKITAMNFPVTGNAAFGLQLSDALPATAAVLLLDGWPGALPIGGGCSLHVGLRALVPLGAATDQAGSAALPLGIPSDPALVGASLYCQWAVIDPGGAFQGLACFSGGMRLLIGN